MDEANVRRMEVLAPVVQELRRHSVTGLSMTVAAEPHGAMGISLRMEGRKELGRIEAVWADLSWAPNYRPWPTEHPAFFEITFRKVNDYGLGLPETQEPVITASVTDAVAAALSWASAPTLPPAPHAGRAVQEDDLRRLKIAANVRHGAKPESVVIEEEALQWLAWRPDEALRAAKRIAINFPRGEDGRVPVKESVLLTPFGAKPNKEINRSQWLAVVSPDRRRDPQVLTVGVRWLIAANEKYRWETAPWLWNGQADIPRRRVRWGVEPYSQESEADETALCSIRYQDTGEFGKAFHLYGIEADEDVWETLRGTASHTSSETELAACASAIRDTFLSLAPWRVVELIGLERQKIGSTRKPKPIERRLFSLPHQVPLRRISLILATTTAPDARITFKLVATASNQHLAEIHWRRPIDMDLQRFGLESEDFLHD